MMSAPPEHAAEARPMRKARRKTRAPQVLLGVLAAIVVLGGVACGAFGPIVRKKIAAEAERRHVEVDVGSVRPGFFALTLRDVRVRPQGVAGIEIRLDKTHVDLTAGDVDIDGGAIVLDGEPEDLKERLRLWRERGGPKAAAPDDGAKKRIIRAENLSLAWKLPSGGELTGSGIRASRDGAGVLAVECARCVAGRDHLSVEATDGRLELGPDNVFKSAHAQALSVAYDPPRTPAPPPTTTATDPEPPPLPVSTKKGARPPPAPVSDEPFVPFPDLHAFRARIMTGAAVLRDRLPDGAKIDVDGLSAKIEVGGEPVAFGPAPFSMARTGDRIHIGFSSGTDGAGGNGTTPLAIDADIPLVDGEVNAQLAGGPVSLALLGVKEGTKGLTDVAHGTISGKGRVVLSANADALTFDGSVALHGINLTQPKISPEPLRGLDLAVAGRGLLDHSGKLRVDDAQVDMGAFHAKAHGTLEESAQYFAIALSLDVAPAACQALFDSAPQGLLPTVRSARIGGTFGANLSLAWDTRQADKLALDYRIDDQCKMLEVPRDIARDRFAGSFSYRTYHPDGTTFDTTTGPGTASWTALDDISPFMVAAVLTTEDGAFYKHKGFNHSAIHASVLANLKARRFVRGASTISMQLAKNLFLARDKALSRKLEEVILTDYLEQIFRKDDLMELYLNIVELGPDVYGVTAAAEHYFGRKPEELNVLECYFLASLLPSPVRYGKMWDKGEPTEGWMRHLQALMTIGARNSKISHSELDEGLKESLVFVKPGDPRPEPRKPVTSTRGDPFEDNDAAWRPLD